jgi:hypothetical protein
MWSTKKFIIVMVVAAVLAAGSIGGIALAQDNGDENGTQPEAQHSALLERVCAIYEDNTGTAINAEELQNAFAQAQGEIQTAAMEAHLAKMVENGVIDETQAQELQDWWGSRPEDLPFGLGLGGHGMPRCFGGAGGFRGEGGPPPAPAE